MYFPGFTETLWFRWELVPFCLKSSFFCPKLFSGFGLLPSLCFDFRTQLFLVMRHRTILHSLGVWKMMSSSKLQMVEALSGERYDQCGDPLIPSLGWVTACLCMLFLGLFHLGLGLRSSHFVHQYLSTQLRNF